MRVTTPRLKSFPSRSRVALAALTATTALLLAACVTDSPARETLLSGETMGSAWTVKIAGGLPMPESQLRDGIQARFDAVNLALSTWRDDSALSRFNADDRGEWVTLDPELAQVLGYALSLADQSNGAYDVTVGPLVNLWGFGPDPALHRAPSPADIQTARARVGWHRIQVDVAGNRARKEPGVRVDLSSLGKGRGVDRVAEYLDAHGVTDYLIDLSGKLRARGTNVAGVAWRVAVERPEPDVNSARAPLEPTIVELRDESIATAGDYRRYFESGGRHFSHIIDPRTGEPVNHATVSSTVLTKDCMSADALATLLMVMPPDDALALADRQRLLALLIGRESGSYIQHSSAAWIAR
jgi:FAD:protein FMN transferase